MRDPSGRHFGRYWDGNQWTDHVISAETVPGVDPVEQPGHAPRPASAGDRPGRWARDPYRRHASRYWDGGRWTEHVMSAARVPSTDPVPQRSVELADVMPAPALRGLPQPRGGASSGLASPPGMDAYGPVGRGRHRLRLGDPPPCHQWRSASADAGTDERHRARGDDGSVRRHAAGRDDPARHSGAGRSAWGAGRHRVAGNPADRHQAGNCRAANHGGATGAGHRPLNVDHVVGGPTGSPVRAAVRSPAPMAVPMAAKAWSRRCHVERPSRDDDGQRQKDRHEASLCCVESGVQP